jgi:hypothetical protein
MRMTAGAIALSLLAAACTGTISGDDDDGSNEPVTLAFTSPAAGSTHVRDALDPALGWLAADVPVELAITGLGGGPPATVELSAGGVALGTADATGRAALMLIDAGTQTITATAKDAGGAVLATATVDVEVVEPAVADCHGWLDLYGATYTLGPVRQGVADPVTLTTPINGLPYRYSGNADVRPTFFMDCSLARSLLEAAPYLRARGVVEVTDIGVYNYRCIGEGTPPDCPNGMSQHAYAKGIDLAGFTLGDGTFFSVNDDWVIDPDAEKTCDAPTEGDADTWLHETICALKGGGVWNIVLTPNYNSAHRNHFHVDLTTGSNYINKRAPVDHGPDNH